jgi:transposase-like protein
LSEIPFIGVAGSMPRSSSCAFRWYITYRLSYRDLVAMMAERGIVVSHTTIHRWVIRYVPEFEKRWNRFARPVNTS